ncbi:iron ABC transporter ATP-binding protein [Sinisalibacter aestuarii]|uniref:ABC transporter ATP-binding protein n=1 Tax=Sinisalibacter aestuarii TaxID=2949426 RepID=A0ABQ5LVW6_9RHOB|nr:ATP-binding cassette domain-containing protein [Sinisalibacter aestuarii]GKY89132.1 ABC transporter ATP-binding protein [Sinisalibacter aestuarii]
MIRIENVSFAHGAAPVLHDISLDIPRGGITALVGANGAGKSTLLSLIARLAPLQGGRIVVDDLEVGACRSDELARKLAILPQTADAAPRLTVRELVGFGRYPYHKGRPGRDDHAKVEAAIAAFELGALADRPLDTLSGGQRQRAQVAMTYAQDTDYVLLDEPLNNLDIAGSRALMQLLQHLAREHGRTIVVVLHDLNYASAYADHLVTMRAGRIAEAGHPTEVVTADMLRDTFGTEAGVHHVNGAPVVLV